MGSSGADFIVLKPVKDKTARIWDARTGKPIGGHSVGCYLNNAKVERTENNEVHAAILTRPELSDRRFPAVAAARSHRKSPDRRSMAGSPKAPTPPI
jgi:hypothetical protein